MLIGLVKWFDTNKGFGVLGTPNGEEYFLHSNSFTSKPEKILKGTPFTFFPKVNKGKNRYSADKSRIVGIAEDWKTILSYLDKPDSVEIENEVTMLDKHGKIYRRKEKQLFSLVDISVLYLFRDKSEKEISNLIIDYFDRDLNPKLFIYYCEFVEYAVANLFSSETSANILNKVFSHFGNNLNEELLFIVWKQKKFKFISYNEMEDHEISENILKEYILEIGKTELNRIIKFSFGPEFCSYYVNNKFSNLDIFTFTEIKELYQFIEFETETEIEKRKHQLDSFYVHKIETELLEKAYQLDTIRNIDDFNDYNRLLQFIPSQFADIEKIKITEAIYQIIAKKCSDEYKAELWLKGIIKDSSFELITKFFFDNHTQTEKRISILAKLETIKQFELLKKYSEISNFENAFKLLRELLNKENSLVYYFDFSKALFDNEYMNDKKGGELIELFANYVNTQSNDEQKYELFLKGYVKNVPQKIVRQNIHQLENEECKKIFKIISEDKPFITEILTEKITLENRDSLRWLYDLAIEFLDQDNFNSFDKKVFYTIEEAEYFKFWEKGKAKIFPQHYIDEILQDKFENYYLIKNWIENNIFTKSKISDFLFSYLLKNELVTNRIVFYKQINHIRYLLLLDASFLIKIKQIQNNIYNVILWVLDKDNYFDFELLKQNFIYFAPDEQILILRKLFLLKANCQFDLTIEKLEQLTRFDLDLYKTNLRFNPDIPIDISTDVVIKALSSYQKNNRFFVESELLTIILNDMKLDKTRRFRLANYFEKCLGRLTAEYNWNTSGKIYKVNQDNNKFYYVISFEFDSSLVEAVKSIPGRKWNSETKVWSVPSQYEIEVLNFARKYRFFIDLDGSNYKNNIHLANFKRTIKKGHSVVLNIPSGISFCEGRLASKLHKTFEKEFWWCAGQSCFGKCETIHNTDEWKKYTLLDFCEILGLNTDETNKMGDYIPKGHYYQFIALINRFNRLLEKLYCQDCNHILYPSNFGASHYGAHTVVRFQCRNDACSNNDEIYLNHCLNGQCNCVIDSRVSKQCENGLFICHNCGSCCSHKQMEKRLDNLLNNDNADTHEKKWIIADLTDKVKNKNGHLEKAEYFCYKCKSEMNEITKDVFLCSNCHVKYDTTKYNIDRPHIHLKKKKPH